MSASLAVRSKAKSVVTGVAAKQLAPAAGKKKPVTPLKELEKHKLVRTNNLGVVSTLPVRLLNFFAKYPPEIYSGAARPSLMTLPPQLTSPLPPPPPEPAVGEGEAKVEAEIKIGATGSGSAEAVAATEGATEAATEATAEKLAEASGAEAKTAETITTTQTQTTTSITAELGKLPSPYTANRDAKGTKKPDPTVWSPSKALLQTSNEHPNPFLPYKHKSGKWWGPRYSLRIQADLVKLAKKHGVEELLPIGRKSTIFKETRRMERGLAIKGTGIGQKVKGHKWERLMETKLEDRRKAMMEMPELIRLWKQVSTISPPLFILFSWKLTVFFREDTDEDGRNGPNGRVLEKNDFCFSLYFIDQHNLSANRLVPEHLTWNIGVILECPQLYYYMYKSIKTGL